MKVKLTNRTPVNQFVCTDGNAANLDGVVVLGPRGTEIIEVLNEKQFLNIQKDFKGKVDVRKV